MLRHFLFWLMSRLALRGFVPAGTKARVISELEASVVQLDYPRLTQQPSETAQAVLACYFCLCSGLHDFHNLRARKITLAFYICKVRGSSFKLVDQICGAMLLGEVCEGQNFCLG